MFRLSIYGVGFIRPFFISQLSRRRRGRLSNRLEKAFFIFLYLRLFHSEGIIAERTRFVGRRPDTKNIDKS